MTERLVAVDLGASSGRVYAATVESDRFSLSETARFVNGAVQIGGRLYWDVLGLYRGILDGLASALRDGAVASVGVDSWAVDYGLIRGDGTLLANPASYRDTRTESSIKRATGVMAREELFARTGIAHQPFNTLFQVMADDAAGHLHDTHRALLIPDLVNYFLTGVAATELTNASTTQLMAVDGSWDEGIFGAMGLASTLFAELVEPGHVLGALREEVVTRIGTREEIKVINVASHDTASAVVAVPATTPHFAYISCGTWSLVGTELDAPILSGAARDAGFSNERGIEGTYRFLHNVMGLWLLQESIRIWELQSGRIDVASLVDSSAKETALRSVIDINDETFLTPGDMPSRIAERCRRDNEPVPQTPAQFTRCIIDSLALAYSDAIQKLQTLSGHSIDAVHIVGGGVDNRLLCQLTADACAVDVIAGPVEAAAVGNVLIQANALGLVTGDRWALRRFLLAHHEFDVYHPNREMTKRFQERAKETAKS
jgi:rhamnulokinase